mmetsp:Transcript_6363/g.10690  ORF Transcript_6363/g.10690 Transcript_6363/m.10690 type:complete len:126 (+) Transcript_6363:347-724(+)
MVILESSDTWQTMAPHFDRTELSQVAYNAGKGTTLPILSSSSSSSSLDPTSLVPELTSFIVGMIPTPVATVPFADGFIDSLFIGALRVSILGNVDGAEAEGVIVVVVVVVIIIGASYLFDHFLQL